MSLLIQFYLNRVLAQTSARVVNPKETRPNEGRLRLQLKNSHTMMFNFETGRYEFDKLEKIERNIF
jgi:hypothetical protein